MSLSLAQVNTYLFLETEVKLFDFLSWLLKTFLFDLLNPKVTTREYNQPHLCIFLHAFFLFLWNQCVNPSSPWYKAL